MDIINLFSKRHIMNILLTVHEVYGDRKDKFICLMDLALMGMKKLKQDGLLDNMEESDEINACSIVVPVEFEDRDRRMADQL